jgi:hypothetical protein
MPVSWLGLSCVECSSLFIAVMGRVLQLKSIAANIGKTAHTWVHFREIEDKYIAGTM